MVDANVFISAFGRHAHLIPDDPDDAPILAAAVKAKVDILVSGNKKHFLNPKNKALHETLVIMSP